MACALQAVIAAANTCTFPTQRFFHSKYHSVSKRSSSLFFTVRASTEEDPDCNDEECAPDKEVGKISGEWLAGEKTRVVGTYPPRKKGWTGYVEKDTAGQTNIYSVESDKHIEHGPLLGLGSRRLSPRTIFG
nr:protein MAINTENANCE OF PSII UNDER HIGH LIGHT 1-like isoform X2 [Quercus suber]